MKKIDFEHIYQQYFKDIYLFLKSLSCSEEIAEEITQETFFKVIKSIDNFDGSKDIRAWIFAIAKNTYFTHYKKNKHTHFESTETFSDDLNILDILINKDSEFTIHQILHTMEEPYKEVFTLRVFGELSFDKIGHLFNKNASWARVTYYRAKNKIRINLEEIENENKL